MGLYYYFGIFVIITNLIMLFRYKRIFIISEWTFKYRKYRNCNPRINDFRKTTDYYLLLLWSISIISSAIWTILGLLSCNWPILLFLCVFNVIANMLKNTERSSNKNKLSISLIQLVVLLAVVLLVELSYFGLNLFG
jgi:hypothetical protein